jgi:ferredoxin/flavodoxin
MAADTTIFYFTATGNSLKVAHDLADALGGVELLSIPQMVGSGDVPAADCAGIVFPTYFGGMPMIVRRFLQVLPPSDYTFAVTTCGGTPGFSLKQAAKELKGRGIELAAGFAVDMPGNYTRLYGANPRRRQRECFDRERERVPEIAEAVRSRRRGPIEGSFFLVSWVFALLYRFYFSRRVKGLDALFFADERCNGCGVCTRVCPVADIELREGRPEWQGRCEQCYACLQWCPQEAIQANRKTSDRKRYRNPDVALEDVVASNRQASPSG